MTTNATQNSNAVSASREGLTFCKLWRLLSIPFSPRKLSPWFAVDSIAEIDIQRLINDGIQGVLLDADGVLASHRSRVFPEPSLAFVREMMTMGLRVAIYTNADESRFQQFEGVPVVKNVPAKPDRKGFEIAAREYLNVQDFSRVCMVGDNFVTDGGAVEAGMRFVHVKPIAGCEKPIHRWTRRLAYECARLYFPGKFRTRSGLSS
ncbi:MAG: HAD family hydrolase [Candidatus Nitrohelix vancouverensis]|uniref:HAD family hydrolase n=1 Tax=Candidatus Nitrohelix vancouverensis TaxID=2705534 RepID=A0A7T0C2J6_9BACT|nr:MAG: HAD family hydrolase [Candidatus Nitrohelix vancouverensis]